MTSCSSPSSPLAQTALPADLDSLRPALLEQLENGPVLLCAPPGAGKSTRIPLWLLEAPFLQGKKILLLEPRRVAARALGRYLAGCLGQKLGETVGLRMRQETLVSAETRLEVVTEGVLGRLILQDAELPGVGCVIFDEFHERSLQADTGLALCLESQQILRPDLRLLVMSATLEEEALRRVLPQAPLLRCTSRQFPVDIRHLPPPPGTSLLDMPALLRHAAGVITRLMSTEGGSLLAFLPGTGEIRLLADMLSPHLPADVDLYPLHGRLDAARQDAAIAPAPAGRRKLVLATNIAETSLTIDGVRLVVDTGLAREPRFDPGSGLTRLATCRISLASARQRSGRAGRQEAGICVRLWHREEENALRPRIRPEILDADLAPLVLQLAAWGVPSPAELPWPDTPPPSHADAARESLLRLGALDPQAAGNRPTPLGRAMAALPVAPRLARLLLLAERQHNAALACCLAALLEERDPLPQGDASLLRRLDWLCRSGNQAQRSRQWALRLARLTDCPREHLFEDAQKQDVSLGFLTALAFPERVAQRSGEADGLALYQLRNGKAAYLPLTDPLSRHNLLAVATLDGGSGATARGRIRLAAVVHSAELEMLFPDEVEKETVIDVTDDGRVMARQRRRLGALALDELPLPRPDARACATALCAYIRRRGLDCLPWSDGMRQWRARVNFLHSLDAATWPDMSDAVLLDTLEDWLGPYLGTCTDLRRWSASQLADALRGLLPYPLPRRLEQLAPCQWTTPAGTLRPIIYGEEGGPYISAKLQEFFGCTDTPRIADGQYPLTLHLNSPAGRPMQVTRDLAAFWRNGYRQVRAEMRGRYPKHPWPEDPLTAPAVSKTKKQLERG